MRCLYIGLLSTVLLSGCIARDETARGTMLQGNTMGTTYVVRLGRLLADTETSGLHSAIDEILANIDADMSTYRADSTISRFNDLSGTECFAVSDQMFTVVRGALRLTTLTGGAFDVTVGPLVNLWGFGARPRPPSVPSEAAIRNAMLGVGARFVETCAGQRAIRKTRRGVEIDLSAIAKGFAVDVVSRHLAMHGIENFLVEIGGEIRVGGRNISNEPWRVAIQKPSGEPAMAEVVLALEDLAVATSGDYRNFFTHEGVRYTHLLDPRTGRPVAHELVSVTVADSSAMRADALATALVVLGPEHGRLLAIKQRIPALFVSRNGDSFVDFATPSFKDLIADGDEERARM